MKNHSDRIAEISRKVVDLVIKARSDAVYADPRQAEGISHKLTKEVVHQTILLDEIADELKRNGR